MSKSVRWAFNFTKWSPSEAEIALATACLQREEKERLARFVFKKDFKSSLIGRLMMRKFVHENSDVGYEKINFSRDEKGKPTLQNDCPNLSFNVSHQGDYTVLAGEVDGCLLGVDVMKLEYTGGKSVAEFFRIMNRNFSAYEWNTIGRQNCDREKIGMFCRHWSLKESYVKAIGVGITVNLQDISFKVNTEELGDGDLVVDTELYYKRGKQNWFFEEMKLGGEHCVSVALNRKSSSKIMFDEISFEELTKGAVTLLDYDREYCAGFFKKLDK